MKGGVLVFDDQRHFGARNTILVMGTAADSRTAKPKAGNTHGSVRKLQIGFIGNEEPNQQTNHQQGQTTNTHVDAKIRRGAWDFAGRTTASPEGRQANGANTQIRTTTKNNNNNNNTKRKN